MSGISKWLLGCIAAIAVAVVVLFLARPPDHFRRKYDQIKPEMSVAEVSEILGPANDIMFPGGSLGDEIHAAFANGLQVTALHNHFFFDEPKVYFMHIGGTGEPEKLAGGVKAVWDAIKKVRAENPRPGARFAGDVPKEGKLDQVAIEKAIGHKGETQSGVVKVTIGREGTMHGVKVAGSMGLTTWAAFSGSDELAAVDGDFIMTAAEVQPVLKTLRKSGIHIVALHNHMMGEQPAFYFTHFWGKGKAADLAASLRTALDIQAKARRDGKGH